MSNANIADFEVTSKVASSTWGMNVFSPQDEVHRDRAEEEEGAGGGRGAEGQGEERRGPSLRAAREHPGQLRQEDRGDAVQSDAERNP